MPFISHSSRAARRVINFGRSLPAVPPPERDLQDWMQARVPSIRASLERARALPSGGWYVVDASRRITDRPSFYWIDGREVIAWRSAGRVLLAPNSCPHMGAPLSAGRSEQGELVCPWHGLRLGEQGQGRWKLYAAHDDGILTWVRLGPPDAATPVLATDLVRRRIIQLFESRKT
jgi:isorenieratene synthase